MEGQIKWDYKIEGAVKLTYFGNWHRDLGDICICEEGDMEYCTELCAIDLELFLLL